jgi:hypothetical protein
MAPYLSEVTSVGAAECSNRIPLAALAGFTDACQRILQSECGVAVSSGSLFCVMSALTGRLARVCREAVPHSAISFGFQVRVISLEVVAIHQRGAWLRD